MITEPRIAVVTGANSGIGKETCIGLSKTDPPHTIIMGCRNLELAEASKKEIEEKTKNDRIFIHHLDLSDLESVKKFSEEVRSNYSQIDTLVNNAGLITYSYTESASNQLELQFATNHLGHFYLTKLLLPLLQKSSDARIINVSSMAHYRSQSTFESYLDTADLTLNDGEESRQNFRSIIKNNYSKFFSYSHSKYANVLFNSELTEQLSQDTSDINKNITCYTLHPGVIKTNFGSSVNNFFFKTVSKMIFSTIAITPEKGALTTLHCCLSPDIQKYNGYYFDKCKPVFYPYSNEKTKKYGRLLWDLSEKLIKK